MNIKLHIKLLVMDDIGIDPQQVDKLKSVDQGELARQLQFRGFGSAMQSHHKYKPVDGGSISIGNTLKPDKLGQQIGAAVVRGLRK